MQSLMNTLQQNPAKVNSKVRPTCKKMRCPQCGTRDLYPIDCTTHDELVEGCFTCSVHRDHKTANPYCSLCAALTYQDALRAAWAHAVGLWLLIRFWAMQAGL
jgi:hypothetical protein